MNASQLIAHFDHISEAPDAIQRLRQFILDLVVRGKLVKQDPNDEPASELLKRIHTEKSRLVKEGQARREKPLPPVTSEEMPFDPPAGWQWVRIRQVTGDRGQTIPKEDFTYIDVTAINKEVGCIAEAKVLSASDAPSRARKLVRTGDVLYSCVRPYLLNVAVIDRDIRPPPIASTAFAVLNGFGLMLSQYLWIVLRSPFMVKCVEVKMRGQAYPAINDSDFALLPLLLPPLAEQHRMVAKVDELMALCDRLEVAQAERESLRDRLVAVTHARLTDVSTSDSQPSTFFINHLPYLTTRPEHIQQLRRTILNLAVRGKLVPQDLNDEPASKLLECIQTEKARRVKTGEPRRDVSLPTVRQGDQKFELPPAWSWCRLRSLASALGDGLHGTPTYTTGGTCYFVNGNNLDNGKIVIKPGTKSVSLEEMNKHRKPLTSHTILVSINGTLGKVAFYDGENIILGKSACYLNLTEFTEKRYVKVVFDSPYFVDYARDNATGTTILNLSLKAMNEFPFPLPPLAEQHRIVAKVDELMALCDRLEAQLNTAQTESRRLLEALLHEALAPAAETMELETAA